MAEKNTESETTFLYISSTPQSVCSGGGSGISNQCFAALQKHVPIRYCHVPLPPARKSEALRSKLMKLLRLPRTYFAYSDTRLTQIAAAVERTCRQFSAQKIFFAGFTQWIKTSISKPYVAYNDICFATYVEIYNRGDNFSSRDLSRIFELEKNFLVNAECVFFRSAWGMEAAKKAYGIAGENFCAVGRGGVAEIPEDDIYSGKKQLLFISREFIPKGGDIACRIFERLKKRHHDVELAIVGAPPPKQYLDLPGIKYYGFINKSVPEEKARFAELLGQAMFLLHPTEKDTNPLVLSEAGYFGCPSVSVRAFAIPELVHDGEDGILLDSRSDIDTAVAKIENYLSDRDAYMKLRLNARRNHTTRSNWDTIAKKMLDKSFIDKRKDANH